MDLADLAQEALEAAERTRPDIRETYVEPYALLQAGDDTQVTASTGNHGAAVAYALGRLDSSGLVFVPTGMAFRTSPPTTR